MKYFVQIYIGRQKGNSGEGVKGCYNFDNSCSNCGTSAKLIGNLPVKGISAIKKDFFATFNDDFLISESLYNELILNQVNLSGIKNVVDMKDNALPYYHFTSNFVFPPFLAESTGLKTDRQCPICNRNGYFSEIIMGILEKGIKTQVLPLKLKYSNIEGSFLKQSDVFVTWEHMGYSNLKTEGKYVMRLARPLLIVSEKVKSVFETLKIKDVKFEEIEIIPE